MSPTSLKSTFSEYMMRPQEWCGAVTIVTTLCTANSRLITTHTGTKSIFPYTSNRKGTSVKL